MSGGTPVAELIRRVHRCVCRALAVEKAGDTHKNIVEAVSVLSRIYSDEMIAGILDRAKLPTARGARGNYWTRALITSLRANHGIGCHDAP